jgi:peptidoglycan-N-acetylglucosamine deacetylase
MGRQIIAIVSLTLFYLSCAGFAGYAAAAGETHDQAPLCWAPGSLAFKTGEERIQKKISRAYYPPPQGQLAEFSPIAQRGVVRRVNLPPGKKLIALTFDLCEEPYEVAGYQGGIVDFLRKEHVKATFFAGGKWMLSHPDRSQQLMSDPLFEVANHTWEHRNLRLLSGQALVDEIRGASLAYERVRANLEEKQCMPSDGSAATREADNRLTLFRYPFGACDPASLDAVATLGLQAVQWDVSSGDPEKRLGAQRMVHAVLAAVRPGSIVLFHANGRGWHTQAALPAIVAALKAKNFQFATVSELLGAGQPEIAPTCYDAKPGDADHYDRLARRLDIKFQDFKRRFSGEVGISSRQAGTHVPSLKYGSAGQRH